MQWLIDKLEEQIVLSAYNKLGGTQRTGEYRIGLRKAIDFCHEAKEMYDEETKVTENTSDGYHTFKELYEYRMLYNALIFNEWAKQGLYEVHKSLRHNDGELCFGGGWFVVVAMLPSGMITNHYEEKYWDNFKIPSLGKSSIPFDGHTPNDVANRISEFLKQ